MTYEDYLDLMKDSSSKCRKGFQLSYYGSNRYGFFQGQIEKITKNRVCFNRIYIFGMHSDGSCFEEKEDHVWMDQQCFNEYQAGDCLSFCAEVYQYIKTGNGKILDFGLRNPEGIEKISAYDLPTAEELKNQTIETMICDACPLSDYCFNVCLNKKWFNQMKKDFVYAIRENNRERMG